MEKSTEQVGDYFYYDHGYGAYPSTMAGLQFTQQKCRSRCIQDGKACPLYQTCQQARDLRTDLLP